MTSDTSESLRFWAHQTLAKKIFFPLGLMSLHAFQEAAWCHVCDALHGIPRLFQLWACKQVMDAAGTDVNQAFCIEGHDPHCPSCDTECETCAHVLHCAEVGRVDALKRSIGWLNDWLRKSDTDPKLRSALVQCARGRGVVHMETIVRDCGAGFREFGRSQDQIGW